eukprot:764533_1
MTVCTSQSHGLPSSFVPSLMKIPSNSSCWDTDTHENLDRMHTSVFQELSEKSWQILLKKNTFLIDQICAKKPDDNDGIGVVVGKLPCVFGDYAVVKRCTSGNVRNGELDWKVEVIDKRQPKWFSLGKLIETTDDRVLRLCGVFDYVHINNTPICGVKLNRHKRGKPKLRVLSQVACTNGASVKIESCSAGEQSGKYKIVFILPDGTTTEKDGFTDMFVSTFEENNKIFEEICRDAALMNTK